MHIPVFSALAANTRWNNGIPDLMTMEALLQANADAPYWEKELRAGNMRPMDEAYHLERFRFLSFVHHAGFWNALVDHMGEKHISFWLPAVDSAIDSGNTLALEALNTRAKHSRQALFFEWLAFISSAPNIEVPHSRSLAWFAQDPALHEYLYAFSEKTLCRDYASAMLTGKIPLWWDAPNATWGATSVLSRAKEWCALDDALATPQSGLKNALSMLTCLNKIAMDRKGVDPKQEHRKEPPSLLVAASLEESVALICARVGIPLGLARTLAGRMTSEDLENPILCAVVQFEDPFVIGDPHCFSQHRAPLREAQYMQVKNNAKFAEPLPTLLDMNATRGVPWEIYTIAEPFMSKRPIQSMSLPENLFDGAPCDMA